MKHTNDKPRIAIVSDAIYPYNKGGKEKRIYELSHELQKRNYNVTIYCMQWWQGECIREEEGISLRAISPYYPLYTHHKRSIKEALLFAISCFSLLTKDFDIVDVDHMPHLVVFTMKIVCIFKRKKLIVTWNEVWGKKYWQEYLGYMKGFLAYLIEFWSAHLADTIISVSNHTTERLQSVLHVTKSIYTIPNGVDYDRIQLAPVGQQRTDLIFAGRLLSHKHIDVLLNSIVLLKKKYPKLACIIVGEGPEKDQLENSSKELEISDNVTFCGALEKDQDLYALYKSSKVFVLPSTREGFGRVILEANACGIPAVTINHPENSARFLIKEGENGFLCELSAKELAKTIHKTLVTHFFREKIQNFAKFYRWDTLVDKIEEAYIS